MITHQYLSSAYTIVVNNQLAERLFIITAILTITDNLNNKIKRLNFLYS